MTRETAESLHLVLTGATEGIGREMALQLADEGAVLTLAARNRERLDIIVKECQERGARVQGIVTDVADQSQCNGLIDAAAKFAPIEGLINNAGITMWTEFEKLETLDVLEQVMRVNYLGAAYLTHAALPHLRKSKGRLAVISSLAGLTGVPTRSGYAASKHAVIGFFDSLRIELLGSGVSVTIVAPNFVRSKIHERALTADGTELGQSPLANRKVMSSEECARQSIDAIMKRQRLRVMTPQGHTLRWLRLLVPRYVDKLAYNAIYGDK